MYDVHLSKIYKEKPRLGSLHTDKDYNLFAELACEQKMKG